MYQYFAITADVFLILAAVLNAMMDKLDTYISFDASIFCKWDEKFWCKPVSAHTVGFIKGTKYRPDGWHLCKSAMIVCLAACAACLFGFGATACDSFQWWMPAILFLFYGAIWNLAFNTAYKLFTKK